LKSIFFIKIAEIFYCALWDISIFSVTERIRHITKEKKYSFRPMHLVNGEKSVRSLFNHYALTQGFLFQRSNAVFARNIN